MSDVRDSVARLAHALEAQLSHMLVALQSQRASAPLEPEAARACIDARLGEVGPLYERARAACIAARAEADKPGMWDEVLANEVYARVHTFVLEAGNATDAHDRLDVALCLTARGMADAALPLAALEDLLDRTPIHACAELFAYAETRQALLAEHMAPNAGKGLVLLRLCNELLRRLSKMHVPQAALAGRIRTLLSTTFPVNERSGVNLRGDFDVENTTATEDVPANEPVREKLDPGELSAHPQFYVLFWSLQRYFANPALLFGEAGAEAPGAAAAEALGLLKVPVTPMHTFHTAAQCVLDVVRAMQPTKRGVGASSKAHRREPLAPPAKRARNGDAAAHPKYLTTPALLDYELQDVLFQRQLLTQFLFLFQYLLGLSHASRERAAEWKNKLLLPAHELSEEDEKWTRTTWRHVQALLRAVPDGKTYLDMVLGILRRESGWVQWKGAGAPALEKAPLDAAEESAWTQRVHTVFSATVQRFPYALGTPELSLLWSEGFAPGAPSTVDVTDEGQHKTLKKDGLEALEMPPPTPSLHTLSRTLHMEEQRAKQRRAAGLEDPAREMRQSIAWRALRAAGPETLHLFGCMQSVDDVPGLLRAIDDDAKGREFEVPQIGAEPVDEMEVDDEPKSASEEEPDADGECEVGVPEEQGNSVERGASGDAVQGAKDSTEQGVEDRKERETRQRAGDAEHGANNTDGGEAHEHTEQVEKKSQATVAAPFEAHAVERRADDQATDNIDSTAAQESDAATHAVPTEPSAARSSRPAEPSSDRFDDANESSDLTSSSSPLSSNEAPGDADATFMTAPGGDDPTLTPRR